MSSKSGELFRLKNHRKLKKRILSGLIALFVILTSLGTPITVRADGIPASEPVLTEETEKVTETETAEGVTEEGVTPGEILPSEKVNAPKEGAVEAEIALKEESGTDPLHTVVLEKTENAELSVFSTLEESDVEINPISVHTQEEGLEVIKGYEISGKAENVSNEVDTQEPKNSDDVQETEYSEGMEGAVNTENTSDFPKKETTEGSENAEEKLYVKAEVTEEAILNPRETVALYSVEDNKAKEVIIEDISLESEPCEIDEDVTGIALVKDTGYRHLNINLYPDEQNAGKKITLNGMMPKNAYATAQEVSTPEQGVISKEGYEVLAAYDISIYEGSEEYQPGEEKSVSVSICDDRILSGSNIVLWHIKDDGSKEEVIDFTLEDGKICFAATGFSVYEIVVDENIVQYGWRSVKTVAELDAIVDQDVYISHVSGYFLKDEQYTVKGTRTGILKTKPATATPENATGATLYHVEKTDDEKYVFSCADGDGVKYIRQSADSLLFVTDKEEATAFTIGKLNDGLYLAGNGNYCVNMQGGAGGNGFAAYNNLNDGNAKMQFWYYVPIVEDPYRLNGKTYGLMNNTSGAEGKALMASSSNNAMEMLSVVVRLDKGTNMVYVTYNEDISLWTFHADHENYYLSSTVNGEIKYLTVTESGLDLTDSETEATRFLINPADDGIELVKDEKKVFFNGTGFTIGTSSSADASKLNFVEISDISATDKISYSAQKVSVSKVQNGEQVIVYTRVWNDNSKAYDFYAVDHDGTLHPCYERGDDIKWVGSTINTLLWDFTEYYSFDGKPNFYYELQNTYSGKYIAPQIDNQQVLSDSKIGINMTGRRDGEYYSAIVAWDDFYYSYAGLKADISNKKIVSCPKTEADTFYFAKVETIIPTLTEVDTIDNTQYGITMKMVDFTNKGSGHNEQDNVLGGKCTSLNDKAESGLLSTDIQSNGYPKSIETNKSLSELFGCAQTVNHLFLESTYNASGYFEYDSCQNFASLKGKTAGDFTVYKEIGTMNTRGNNTDKHGQFMPYNDITAGVYSTVNPQNLNDVFGKALPDSDPRKYENLHLVGNLNNTSATDWYFGMEVDASFVQTPSGKDAWGHDIVFEFTGDDDFWLYVDDELVIDLGGIHSALPGRVNFATGKVEINNVPTTLRQVFKDNYEKRLAIAFKESNPEATDEELTQHISSKQTEVEEYLAKYFADGKDIFKDYTSHTMKIFYMERGAGASNLHMRFNLSYVAPGSVVLTKKVTGTSDIDFSLVEYPFQIYYKDSEDEDDPFTLLDKNNPYVSVQYQNSVQSVDYSESYTPPGSSVTYNQVFFLSPDKSVEIKFPSDTIQYKIVECGINSEVYDHVYINDTEIVGTTVGTSSRKSFDSGKLVVADQPNVTVENHVNPEGLRTLYFKKILLDENGEELSVSEDSTEFTFRLSLSNGVDDELVLANMFKYCVKDPNGFICKWQSGSGFVATTYTEADITPSATDTQEVINSKKALRDSMTYETSPNGSIARIPVGYTVMVPNLPVGTKFEVVERNSDIPLGYKLKEYKRTGGTYQTDDGDTLNSGWVRENESPEMEIYNQRGFEIKVNKNWSDADYTTEHAPVYAAVYVKNNTGEYEIVPGQIRQITQDRSYARFFLDSLNAHSFDDYAVFEVEIMDPAVDADGKVTSYTQITKRLNEGDLTNIYATPKGQSTQSLYSYAVEYTRGEPESSYDSTSTNHNIRTDTITNTRTGGVVITLYDMNTKEKLPGGTFTLKQGDDVIGTYTSDSNGRITILYEFDRNADYVLTQTEAPKGYIGVPNPMVFRIAIDDDVTVSGNDTPWADGHKSETQGDKLIAYIDVFNKPYTFRVLKVTQGTDAPLAGAEFALYKGVSGLGGLVKDYNPLTGFESVMSGSDGVLPGIDQNLNSGTYFLTELQAPGGYIKFDRDICFTVDGMGNISVDDASSQLFVQQNVQGNDNAYEYIISVPNQAEGYTLTVTKTVTGAMGNKAKDFTFTFTAQAMEGSTGIDENTEYEWSKNGVLQDTKLKTGDTFTLAHADVVKIVIPDKASVTIAEDNEGYTSTFLLEGEAAQKVSTKTITVDEDKILYVTNTLDGIIPTGVWMPLGGMIGLALIILAGALFTFVNNRRFSKEL